MLELRPTCENCNKKLPPDAADARICSYECTFCASCVENILRDVCPNCGGGFVPRPIRPSRNWNDGNFLGNDPATTTIKHRPVDPEAHARFAAELSGIPPGERQRARLEIYAAQPGARFESCRNLTQLPPHGARMISFPDAREGS